MTVIVVTLSAIETLQIWMTVVARPEISTEAVDGLVLDRDLLMMIDITDQAPGTVGTRPRDLGNAVRDVTVTVVVEERQAPRERANRQHRSRPRTNETGERYSSSNSPLG